MGTGRDEALAASVAFSKCDCESVACGFDGNWHLRQDVSSFGSTTTVQKVLLFSRGVRMDGACVGWADVPVDDVLHFGMGRMSAIVLRAHLRVESNVLLCYC